ncbi:hypothetical protein [Rosistilla carotiformis]|nr:hypothetical protein [Rosistilla carotiformis]
MYAFGLAAASNAIQWAKSFTLSHVLGSEFGFMITAYFAVLFVGIIVGYLLSNRNGSDESEELTTLDREFRTLQATARQHEDQNELLATQLKAAEAELVAAKGITDNLVSANQEFDLEHERLNQQLHELQVKLQQSSAHSTKQTREIQELRVLLDQNASAQKQAKQLKLQLDGVTRELEARSCNADDAIGKLVSQCEDLDREKQLKTDLVAKLEADLDEIEKHVEELQSDYDQTSAQLGEQQSRNESLVIANRQIPRLSEARDQAVSKIAQLEKVVQTQQQQLTEATNACDQMQKQLRTRAEEKQALSFEIDQRGQRITELEALATQLGPLQQKHDAVAANLASTSDELASLRSEFNAQADQIADVQKQLKNAHADLQAERAEKADLQSQANELREELKSGSLVAQDRDRVQTELAAALAKMESLTEQKAAMAEQLARNELQLQAAQKQQTEFDRERKQLQAGIAERGKIASELRDRIAELTQNVSDRNRIQTELAGTQTKLQTEQQQSAELRDAIAQREADNAELRSKLESTLASLNHTQQQQTAVAATLASVQADKDKLNQQIGELKPANAQLRQTIADFQAKLAKADSESQKQLAEQAKQIRAQVDKNQSLSATLTQKQQEIAGLTTQLDELADVRTAMDDLQKTRVELETATRELGNERLENRKMSDALQQFKTQNVRLSEELESLGQLKQELVATSAELHKQTQTCAELRRSLDARQQKNDALTSELEVLGQIKQDLDKSQNEIRTQRATIDRLTDTVTQHQTHNEALQAELKQIKPLQKDLAKTQAQLATAQAELMEERDDNETLEQVVAKQKQERSELVAELEVLQRLKQKLEDVSSKLDAEVTQNDKLRKASTALLAENETLHERCDDLDLIQSRLEAMQAEFSVKSDQLEQAEAQRDRAIDASHALRDQHATLQRDVDKQAKLIEQLQRDQAHAQKELAKASQEQAKTIDQLESQVQLTNRLKADVGLREELELQLQDLRAQLHEAKTHLKRISGEYDASLDANAKAQEQVRELENRLHTSTAQIREMRREIGQMSDVASKPDVVPFKKEDAA